MQEISVIELSELLSKENKVHFIDVRTIEEYNDGHAKHTVNIPLDKLEPSSIEKLTQITKDENVYIICRSGARSANACHVFLEAGYSKVFNVVGGTLAWANENLPMA